MDERRGVGRSLYHGLRVTLTDHPTRDLVLVSVSAKHRPGGWDDWASLAPVTRHESSGPIGSRADALHVMQETLYRLWLEEIEAV
uniref:Uncharacterized protein n=1 Tax=uncultured prokaryote TaxID=198431 RepID=A0A0H5Q6F6_9ZZZZ|nr:hypothetical protein [uncultured prokaryote]